MCVCVVRARAQTAITWLRDNEVVKKLLRTHLHQRQYVDQVQKVLKALALAGGLDQAYMDLLWAVTEKVRAWARACASACACAQTCGYVFFCCLYSGVYDFQRAIHNTHEAPH